MFDCGAATARGYTCNNRADPTNCAHFLSTPKVLQVGRDYFDCPTLQGVEFENQDTTCNILGSHWEQRVLQNEIMAPVLTVGKTHISPMTLAAFEDSGWYSPDYGKLTTPYAKGACLDRVVIVMAHCHWSSDCVHKQV